MGLNDKCDVTADGQTIEPCPFCGLDEAFLDVGYNGEGQRIHRVICRNCWATGPMYLDGVPLTRDAAIAAWNEMSHFGHKEDRNDAKHGVGMEKLGPCPFCGSHNIIVCNVGADDGPDLYGAFCQNCDAEGPKYEFKDVVVKKWNYRQRLVGALTARIRPLVEIEIFRHAWCHKDCMYFKRSKSKTAWCQLYGVGLVKSDVGFMRAARCFDDEMGCLQQCWRPENSSIRVPE